MGYDTKEKKALNDRRRREICRNIIISAKNRPCMDCRGIFPTICMDLDHVRGEKKTNVARLGSKGRSFKAIIDEIAKCEVVCANCHRIRTERRRLA